MGPNLPQAPWDRLWGMLLTKPPPVPSQTACLSGQTTCASEAACNSVCTGMACTLLHPKVLGTGQNSPQSIAFSCFPVTSSKRWDHPQLLLCWHAGRDEHGTSKSLATPSPCNSSPVQSASLGVVHGAPSSGHQSHRCTLCGLGRTRSW